MKLWELATLTAKKPKKPLQKIMQLSHNEMLVPSHKVITNPNRAVTYRELRNLTKPRYETLYLMRQTKGFNTVFFRQNFDVVWCDRNFNIIAFYTDLAPSFVSEHNQRGYFIYFCPVGTINNMNLKIGDELKAAREIFIMPML